MGLSISATAEQQTENLLGRRFSEWAFVEFFSIRSCQASNREPSRTGLSAYPKSSSTGSSHQVVPPPFLVAATMVKRVKLGNSRMGIGAPSTPVTARQPLLARPKPVAAPKASAATSSTVMPSVPNSSAPPTTPRGNFELAARTAADPAAMAQAMATMAKATATMAKAMPWLRPWPWPWPKSTV